MRASGAALDLKGLFLFALGIFLYTKRHTVIDRNSILADNNGHKVNFHRLNRHTL